MTDIEINTIEGILFMILAYMAEVADHDFAATMYRIAGTICMGMAVILSISKCLNG